jgi:hypothetical protein
MPAVNWNTVAQQAIAAAQHSLGASWNTAASGAIHSIQLLVQTAQYIAANSATLDQRDRELLTDNQQLAMKNVLLGCEDISIAAAEQAAAAAWNVVQGALATALAAKV